MVLTTADENTKPIEFKTPSKSRYRDALESPPVTPKHRVQVGGKSMTPRTPRQISSPSSSQTFYTAARQLFARGATSGRLVGRDAEREKLTSFIQERVTSRKGGCLYVSGPPGTGKSAMVREVCNGLGLDTSPPSTTGPTCRICSFIPARTARSGGTCMGRGLSTLRMAITKR